MKIEDAFEETYPEVFQRFYPRKYAAPGGYTSPKAPACVFCVSMLGAMMLKQKHGPAAIDVDPVINNVAAISERLADFWMPTYWVGKELAAVGAIVCSQCLVFSDLSHVAGSGS
jgi:hypothetical protein